MRTILVYVVVQDEHARALEHAFDLPERPASTDAICTCIHEIVRHELEELVRKVNENEETKA